MADGGVRRVFIPGCYTYRNKGDALLALSLVQRLRGRWGAATEITLASWNRAGDEAFYGLPVVDEVLLPYGGPMRRLQSRVAAAADPDAVVRRANAVLLRAALGWGALARRSPAAALRLLPARYRSRVQPLLDADVVVAVPGGYLMAPRPTDVGWISHAVAVAVAVGLGKRTYLSPCSVGPFAPGHRPLAAWLLAHVDSVGVREETSERAVRELTPDARVVRTTDCALGYDFGVAVGPYGDRPARVGVSVRHYYFPRSADPAAALESYRRAVAEAVTHVVRAGYEVVFVPQVRAGGDEDDVAMSHAVLAAVPAAERGSCRVEEGDLSVAELAALYASFRVIIGTRMHANLISLKMATPVVAIAYEHKTTGIMSDLGLSDAVVSIDDVSGDELIRRLDAVLADPDTYRKTLAAAIPVAQDALARWDETLPA